MKKNIIKRNGQETIFEPDKIFTAINKANDATDSKPMNKSEIEFITKEVTKQCQNIDRSIAVEEIQDMVEKEIMKLGFYEVAKNYITYRYKRALIRKANTTDEKIMTLIDLKNEEVKQENSNKNPTINSTQRDYMAGEVSKDLTERFLLPKEIWEAHKNGLIHFHDSDYFAQRMTNCCLINLDDMLQNGTVISDTMIEKPHSFYTACNITTQIIAQVASNQYGGQSFSLAHLAPFVDISRNRIRRSIIKQNKELDLKDSDELIEKKVNFRLNEEIKRGIQTIQYQILTLMTTNGQAPFVTMFMYINEVSEGQTRDDMILLIREVLRQRYEGVKNEKGVWITPAFPKIIYVLDENNASPDSPYYDLTVEAAKCTAKRMVPDYISAKKMKEYKEGDIYPCMGCVDGQEVVTYKFYDFLFVESFERMWKRLKSLFEIKTQPNGQDCYMDVSHVTIYDKDRGFVPTLRIIRNFSNTWLKVKLTNGRSLLCTEDHPFVTKRGRVYAKNLIKGDSVPLNFNQYSENYKYVDPEWAWALGVLLCDSAYSSSVVGSFAATGEDEIIQNLQAIVTNKYNINSNIITRNREEKGCYKDLVFYKSERLKCDLIHLFEGISKSNRHIPNEIFHWNNEAKYSFLAGMIDADGYINSSQKISKIQLGSTNKELALQQLLLAQALGMKAYMYENHYSKNSAKVRYRVEFIPDDILISKIKCSKKRLKFKNNKRTNSISIENDFGSVKEIIKVDIAQYSYDVTTQSDHFDVSGIYSHNCRSFLTVDRFHKNLSNSKNYKTGINQYYGRFNQGVVTINLVDVACSSYGNMDNFWNILDERLELCHKALRLRHDRLLGTPSDVAPILWQHGAYARLGKGEKIDKLLYDGYSTISLGYVGLYEMCMRMLGESHTSPKGEKFSLSVMQHLNDKCTEWKQKENIDYSLYGTPMESTTYKFAKCLQKRFGIIKNVTDHNYITNSYHVNVRESIDAFTKLSFESRFQKLSPGGAISYVEVPNMQKNIEAVLAVIRYIYDNIMYAEINTKSDYCHICGYEGEIQIVEDDNHKLIWQCPNCGNTNQDKMNVARRTCGYIGTHFWNQGRTQEIKERVLHL